MSLWWSDAQASVESLDNGINPKKFIDKLSERLLKIFDNLPLINKYNIYQQLMNYWTSTM
jgi:type I restriction enzyme M protein